MSSDWSKDTDGTDAKSWARHTSRKEGHLVGCCSLSIGVDGCATCGVVITRIVPDYGLLIFWK